METPSINPKINCDSLYERTPPLWLSVGNLVVVAKMTASEWPSVRSRPKNSVSHIKALWSTVVADKIDESDINGWRIRIIRAWITLTRAAEDWGDFFFICTAFDCHHLEISLGYPNTDRSDGEAPVAIMFWFLIFPFVQMLPPPQPNIFTRRFGGLLFISPNQNLERRKLKAFGLTWKLPAVECLTDNRNLCYDDLFWTMKGGGAS